MPGTVVPLLFASCCCLALAYRAPLVPHSNIQRVQALHQGVSDNAAMLAGLQEAMRAIAPEVVVDEESAQAEHVDDEESAQAERTAEASPAPANSPTPADLVEPFTLSLPETVMDDVVLPTGRRWNPGREHPIVNSHHITDDPSWYLLPTGLDYDVDFNSRGETAPFSGDMMADGLLADCFAARAYRNEVIITSVPGGEAALEHLANRILQWKDIGFEHYIVVSDEATCGKIMTWFPDAGCVWSSLPATVAHLNLIDLARHLESAQGITLMRSLLWTRAVQSGYNVLLLDVDVDVLSNPYMWVKHPDLSDINMFSGMYAWPHMKWPDVDPGMVYAQRAAPNGPIAWLGQSMLDRVLRWSEARVNIPGGDGHITDHDVLLAEGLASTIAGVPLFRDSLRPVHANETAQTAWEARHRAACDMEMGPQADVRQLALPREWDSIAAGFRTRFGYPPVEAFNATWDNMVAGQGFLRTHALSLPWNHGAWSADLHGPHGPYPHKRGEASTRLRNYLEQGEFPVWPEEDAAEGSAGTDDSRSLRELWAPMPDRIFSTFSRGDAVGRRGWWAAAPPSVVLAHWTLDTWSAKSWGIKLMGWWHWQASTIVRGPAALEYPKVVAMPLGWATRVKNESALSQWAEQLAMVGRLSGRVPVWPEVDCGSELLAVEDASRKSAHDVPALSYSGVLNERVLAVGPSRGLDPQGERHCYYRHEEREGMHQADFGRLVSGLGDEDALASESNTIWWNAAHHLPPPYIFNDTRVPQVAWRDLADAFQAVEQRPVVYLGMAFKLDPSTVPG